MISAAAETLEEKGLSLIEEERMKVELLSNAATDLTKSLSKDDYGGCYIDENTATKI